MSKSNERHVVCIVKANVHGKDTYNLLTTDAVEGTWTIRGWKTSKEALEYWEGAYRRAHARSYEGSMSACLNFISFNPSILELTLDEIAPLIAGDRRVVNLYTNSGSIDAVVLNNKAAAFWERGSKPALI
jgi:hypothetical protein